MTVIDSIILGAVQGLTEFLPISSSGHLIIARNFLGLDLVGTLAFDAILQLATTLAVVVYFWKDLWGLFVSFLKWVFVKDRSGEVLDNMKMIGFLVVATVPAVIIGLMLEDTMDSVFRNEFLVIYTLIFGAVILYLAERSTRLKTATKPLTWTKSLIIGLFQSLALIPGMSRSGMTISGGLFMNLERDKAVRLSFLMAVPILLGSGLKKSLDILGEVGAVSINYEIVFGVLTSFVVGLLAIHFLITFLKKHTLLPFVWYRIGLAILLIFLFN